MQPRRNAGQQGARSGCEQARPHSAYARAAHPASRNACNPPHAHPRQPRNAHAAYSAKDRRCAHPASAGTPFQQNYSGRSRRSSTRSPATAIAALILVAAVGFAGWFSMQAIQGNLPVADAAYRSPAAATAQSTPMAQWEKGSVPLLYQTDPAWSNIRYAENHFGESGCGPTCMAMVYIALTGATDKDPAAMAELATKGGYAGPDGTAWLFMTEGAASLGLAATEVGADEQSIRRELVKGRPIIASMGPGDFTTTGHFIVITDIDKNSNLVIHDPNSPERSAKAWSFDTVIGQCRALWSYSLI